MSPPRLEIEFFVEDGLPGTWDERRIGDLVRSIVVREVSGASNSSDSFDSSDMPASASAAASSDSAYVLNLHLVSDARIRALNAAHRAKDAATDVLSFPLEQPTSNPGAPGFVLPPGEPIALGEVVVSYPRAVAQAEEYGHSVERELAYLVAHGVLHVLGYDHEQDDDRQRMRAREEEALTPLGFTR